MRRMLGAEHKGLFFPVSLRALRIKHPSPAPLGLVDLHRRRLTGREKEGGKARACICGRGRRDGGARTG